MDSDLLTIRRAIAGDELAQRALWTRHAPHIDAVVRRLVGDPDLAQDVAQDVWIQIFRALPTYRGDAQFGTWAHRIAVNRTLNAMRRVKRVGAHEGASALAVLAPAGGVQGHRNALHRGPELLGSCCPVRLRCR